MAAAPVVSATFEGFENLSKTFDELSAKLQRAALRKTVSKAARPVRKEMKRLVPKDTRATQKGIGISVSVKSAGNVEASIGVRRKAKGRPASTVHLIEKGTIHQPAQPFMRPALDNKKGEVVKIFTSELGGEIAKVAAKSRARGPKPSRS